MSHKYLLDTYGQVEARVAVCRQKMEEAVEGSREWFYWKGRLDALKTFYDFMFETFHPRLPRRLMKRHGRMAFPT
jgi:hypothetical protein